MALQSYRLTIGALIDENNSGKNYVSDQPVYIKTKAGVLAPIFRDINGNSEIFQDGLSNKTDSRGQFVFFVEQGDYIAEYQSQQTPISVFGADYFNSRIEESVTQITADTALSRGYNRKGTFASGFTYELANDVGIDADGDAWVYTDIDALPALVTANTVPSAPEYTAVVFSDHNSLINRGDVGAHDDIYTRYVNSLDDLVSLNISDSLTKTVKTTGLGGDEYMIITKSQADSEAIRYWVSGVKKGNYAFLLTNGNFVAVKVNKQDRDAYQAGFVDDAVLFPYKTNLYSGLAGDYITGLEYNWLTGKLAELNISGFVEGITVFSGDSTTFGVNASTLDPVTQFSEYAKNLGFSWVSAVNEGHSGSRASVWGSDGGWCDDDIANHAGMRMYIARWGINDGSVQGEKNTQEALADFEDGLRSGLQKLRNFKGVDDLVIVLMTPNTISEDLYRNEQWIELIRPIIQKASRDFQCVYFDTYAMFRDARRDGIGLWLDNAGSGQGIHPDKYFNSLIVGTLANALLAPMAFWAGNKFHNIPGAAEIAVIADLPFQYQRGISIKRTDNSWPINGSVTTEQHVDRIAKQTLRGYDSDLNQREVVRFATNLTTWGAWRDKTALTLLNGWTLRTGYGTPRYQKTNEGLLHVECYLDGSLKTGNAMFQLPEGHRPLSNIRCLIHNDDGTSIGTVQVGADGFVLYVSGDVAQVNLNLNLFTFQ